MNFDYAQKVSDDCQAQINKMGAVVDQLVLLPELPMIMDSLRNHSFNIAQDGSKDSLVMGVMIEFGYQVMKLRIAEIAKSRLQAKQNIRPELN